jgi:PAS domain S-box-containing protein
LSTPTPDAFSSEEETQRFRDRIAQLETEVEHLRGIATRRNRQNTEVLPHENELHYKEIFDNISTCMFLVDVTSDGRFKFTAFNRAEEKAVGLTSEEVSGRFVEDVFAPDLAQKLIANYRHCLEAGGPIHYDDELNLPGGQRYFHSNLIPVRNAAGRIERIVGACIDATDFKRAQDEASARQKLESLGTLAGGIAHDFNNLLGGILAQTELALANLAEGVAPAEELNSIRAVAIRGAEIVRQLMSYAGQEPDTLEQVNVSQLTEETIELLRVVVSKHVALRLRLERDVPAVFANPAMLRQILVNLVTNASEAIGELDGVIEITTARVTVGLDSSLASTSLRAGDYLQLEVSDTGRGMKPETRARIFDPFFTTKSHGRGLGLAVVQGIVRRLGGAITARSEPSQGTTFQILLPVVSEFPIKRRDHDTTTVNDGRAAHGCFLVVEDEEHLRLAVSKMLRKEGFTVLEASSGSDALLMLRAHTDEVTVMLLDVTLPGIASTDVLREANRLRPDLPVIITSAYGKESVVAKFPDFGSQVFLRKPYLIADLLTLLELKVRN